MYRMSSALEIFGNAPYITFVLLTYLLIVLRLSACRLSVCDVMYCGETVRPRAKVTIGSL